jgi:ATP-dependent DNA helicase RecG
MEGDKLTNAGYYLFSNKKPVVLKMAVYVTDERINFADITGIEDNIFNLIGHAFSYVKEHSNWRVEAGTDTSRVEVPEIPIDAIREIIVNSFAHADYRAITENEIDITPTQVEIYNPGEFPPNLTPEMFVAQRVKSMPRNKVILNTLYKSKDVEMFGSGFKKTYALCKRYGTKTKYQSDNGGFSFVFYRKDVTINDTVNVTLNMPDTKMIATDVKVLMALKEDPTKTRAEIAGIIGKTIRTVQRSLDKLDSSGKIRRIGSNKTGYWEVFDK